MTRRGVGGRGGDGYVEGDNSNAEGGQGGDAGLGDGGRGGDASIIGNNGRAIGGRGGRGGIGPGGPGGDAHIIRDPVALGTLLQADKGASGQGGNAYAIGEGAFEAIVAGGQGGEASQPDGRGGRGGRAFMPPEWDGWLGTPKRAHIRWPYFELITEPGRGGDAADTPQYKARRIILERLKRQYFRDEGLDLNEAWWDRTVVPLAWLNDELRRQGHHWSATVVDDEYEFLDLPTSAGR